MKIINGYVCECTTDARLAKRGIDPDNPKQDPIKQRELDEKRGKVDTSEQADAKDVLSASGLDAVKRQADVAAVRLDGLARSDPKAIGAQRAETISSRQGRLLDVSV